MTKGKAKQRRLAHEILGLICVSAVFSVMLFLILSWTATAIAEIYCFQNDVLLSELDWLEVDHWIFTMSGVLSAAGFCLLFLALLGDRMTYIRTITAGIEALRAGQTALALPLEGNNELTALADAINQMSAAQQLLREKERALANEKEQFIRTLSHDIRTPLTAILAYSEYLAGENAIPPEQQKAHLQTIRRKTEQIRDLTALLLDGQKRSPEYFDNAHLLMEQLAAGFEEELEDRFDIRTDLSECSCFAGRFDVQELRRIFDNLSSNVEKYADPGQPVHLRIRTEGAELRIQQSNGICPEAGQRDSYKLGINSIRRIAQNYSGRVEVSRTDGQFSITIILSHFL